jgi:hypothetical protein
VSVLDQISYRARTAPAGYSIVQTSASFRDQQKADRWLRRLESWLRAGGPEGCAYLDFGSEAAFIRWQATNVARLAWRSALVRVGQSPEFAGTYALELPEPDAAWTASAGGSLRPGEPGPRHAEIEEQARSAGAIAVLIPLLAHALVGERRVTVPWAAGEVPEAAMWGLISILRVIGDTRSVSFLTYASGLVRDGDIPGLLVKFSTDAAAPLPPDQGFLAIASDLAHRFAQDPEALRLAAAEYGVPDAADHNGRISRLLSMQSQGQPGNVNQGGMAPVSGVSDYSGVPEWATEPETAKGPGPGSTLSAGLTVTGGSPGQTGSSVMCPVCLTDIPEWDKLGFWTYTNDEDYEEIRIPPNASSIKRTQLMHGAYVRCPSTEDGATDVHHYLPAQYARFGTPVLLGFIGLTKSGKSHLLTAMVAEIGRLSAEYGIDVHALDPALHHAFLDKSVKPLIARNEVLPGTPDDASTTFADAFIVRPPGGRERVVALFDVSGGILAQAGSKREFLFVANGLFFVIDPDLMMFAKAGDDTFTNVLNIVRDRPDRDAVSGAVVLNKADKVRFEEPTSRWLRSADAALDPESFLRESADVYSYLERNAPGVLTEPYRVCRKATLHVASATGGPHEGEEKGGKYPRGVTPLGVLRPLVAMLAMTGVLTGPQAEKIGV